MRTILSRLAKDQSGATAIEYSLIVALISVGVIVALGALGQSLSDMFFTAAAEIANATATAAGN